LEKNDAEKVMDIIKKHIPELMVTHRITKTEYELSRIGMDEFCKLEVKRKIAEYIFDLIYWKTYIDDFGNFVTEGRLCAANPMRVTGKMFIDLMALEE